MTSFPLARGQTQRVETRQKPLHAISRAGATRSQPFRFRPSSGHETRPLRLSRYSLSLRLPSALGLRPFSQRETVIWDTPSRAANARIVSEPRNVLISPGENSDVCFGGEG
jgi:hypothetical protein